MAAIAGAMLRTPDDWWLAAPPSTAAAATISPTQPARPYAGVAAATSTAVPAHRMSALPAGRNALVLMPVIAPRNARIATPVPPVSRAATGSGAASAKRARDSSAARRATSSDLNTRGNEMATVGQCMARGGRRWPTRRRRHGVPLQDVAQPLTGPLVPRQPVRQQDPERGPPPRDCTMCLPAGRTGRCRDWRSSRPQFLITAGRKADGTPWSRSWLWPARRGLPLSGGFAAVEPEPPVRDLPGQVQDRGVAV